MIRVPWAETLLITLPSDSTSQWTPLSLAISFPLPGRFRDSHPVEHAPAGRTAKQPLQMSPPRLFVLAFLFSLEQLRSTTYFAELTVYAFKSIIDGAKACPIIAYLHVSAGTEPRVRAINST